MNHQPSEERSGVQPTSFDLALRRARSDFLEMPGLRLTELQARRLWMLEGAVCRAVLSSLVDARFLVRSRDDRFTRATG
jgi:hypothetical protein